MPNEVFANGREVSCKAGDGKSICEFPDVCLTPPENPATPPGVPIPYPNTAFSKDTTSGSKKVKIGKKEVMQKNKSYFKTSVGDEAGCAAKKGVITSKIKGKAYFISWSMDVKFEGLNVVRHLDLTTHNHASPIANGSIPTAEQEGMSKEEFNDKCKLRKYKDGCPGKQTPHHCVPDHCFKQKGKKGEYYPGAIKHSEGLCVCVEGATKSTKKDGGHAKRKDYATDDEHRAALAEHGRIHKKFDKMERVLGDAGNPINTATMGELENTASEVIEEVTGCGKEDLKKQMRDHHDKKGVDESTKLRADPYGRRANPPPSQMGVTNQAAGGATR